MDKINLSGIPRCNQIWEDMQPTEGGRLCAQCNKCIVDFREKSYYEIALIHATNSESVCGVYTEEQLTFNIPKSRLRKKSIFRPAFAVFAALFSLLSKLQAQENAEKILQKEQIVIQEGSHENGFSKQNSKERISAIQKDSIILFGKMIDSNKEPLIGASILVKGHAHGTVTDVDGNFILNLSKIFEVQDTVTIIYSYTGFFSKEKSYSKDMLASLQENIVLEVGGNLEEQLVIKFGVFSRADQANTKVLPTSSEIKSEKQNRPFKLPWQKRKQKVGELDKSKQNNN